MDWLIGIAPNKPGLPALVPEGRKSSTADRLRIILHMSAEEFVTTFPKRDNAMDYTRGRALVKTLSGHVCVFGIDAWRFLGLPPVGLWGVHYTKQATFYLVPHPSGRNQTYNASANRERLRRILCRKRR